MAVIGSPNRLPERPGLGGSGMAGMGKEAVIQLSMSTPFGSGHSILMDALSPGPMLQWAP